MIVSITGHRAGPKMGGYRLPNPVYCQVSQELEKILLTLKPEKLLSGMCHGVDFWACNVCLKLKIPYVSIVPFLGQESRWTPQTQKTYNRLRKLASEEVIVSPGGLSVEKMHLRNQYLVDHSDLLIACYIPGEQGGTKHTIDYAKSIGREIAHIDPTIVIVRSQESPAL